MPALKTWSHASNDSPSLPYALWTLGRSLALLLVGVPFFATNAYAQSDSSPSQPIIYAETTSLTTIVSSLVHHRVRVVTIPCHSPVERDATTGESRDIRRIWMEPPKDEGSVDPTRPAKRLLVYSRDCQLGEGTPWRERMKSTGVEIHGIEGTRQSGNAGRAEQYRQVYRVLVQAFPELRNHLKKQLQRELRLLACLNHGIEWENL